MFLGEPHAQRAPVEALRQLIHEYGSLPRLEWSIKVDGTLGGTHYGTHTALDVLRAYEDVLGGLIEPTEVAFRLQGWPMRMHQLTATWRDVRVEVRVPVVEPHTEE